MLFGFAFVSAYATHEVGSIDRRYNTPRVEASGTDAHSAQAERAVWKLRVVDYSLNIKAGRWTKFVLARLNESDCPITAGLTSVFPNSTSAGPFAFAEVPDGRPVSDLSIREGSSNVTFYYRDERTGKWTLSFVSPGWMSDRLDISVLASEPTGFRIVPSSTHPRAGESVSLTITALDDFGNVATGYTGIVTIMMSASVSPAREYQPKVKLFEQFTPGDRGSITIPEITFYRAEAVEINVTDNSISSLTGSFRDLRVGPAKGTRVVRVSGDEQTALQGTLLAEPFMLMVTDLYGNPVPGVLVNWSILKPRDSGGIIVDMGNLTDTYGVVKATLRPGVIGDYMVQARVVLQVPESVVFTARVNPESNFFVVLTSTTGSVPPGGNVTVRVIVSSIGGYAWNVSLGASTGGAPIHAKFDRCVGKPTFDALLTLTVDEWANSRDYDVKVTAVCIVDGKENSTLYTVTVFRPPAVVRFFVFPFLGFASAVFAYMSAQADDDPRKKLTQIISGGASGTIGFLSGAFTLLKFLYGNAAYFESLFVFMTTWALTLLILFAGPSILKYLQKRWPGVFATPPASVKTTQP